VLKYFDYIFTAIFTIEIAIKVSCIDVTVIIIIIIIIIIVPWQNGKPGKALCRDVTVTCPLDDSCVAGAVRDAGSAAELAAALIKEDKNSSIDGRYLFEPIAIETLGVYSTSSRQLLSDLGRKIFQC